MLFLELTRRCNLKCTHCLRGTAQSKDMTELTMWWAMRKLPEDYLGIGGGEPLMNDTHIKKLRNAIFQSDYIRDINELYMVTNGKGLARSEKLLKYLRENFTFLELIYLHVSTDQYHDLDRRINYNIISDYFEYTDAVYVQEHGPSREEFIVDMGRADRGKAVDVWQDDDMLYVDVDGYVWGSCDLSYTFMKKFRDRAICYGNVVTDTSESIYQNRKDLSEYLELIEDSLALKENVGGITRQVMQDYLEEKTVDHLKQAM